MFCCELQVGIQCKTSSWSWPWKCCRLCPAIKHQCCCWQEGSECKCSTAEKGKRFKETARLQLDWSEQRSAYICSRWWRPSLIDSNSCRTEEIDKPDEGCWVCAIYKGVEEEEKVFHLCHHSEKLAISFGLISTTPGSPLHISKNLRVCCDCHTPTKFIRTIAEACSLFSQCCLG